MRSFLLAGLLGVFCAAVQAQQLDPAAETPCAPSTEESPDEDTRLGQWQRKRIDKTKRIRPYELTKVEKALLWVEDELADTMAASGANEIEESLGLESANLRDLFLDYRDYVFPRAGTVRTGSSLGTGLRFRDTQVGHSSLGLDVSGALSLGRYQVYGLTFGKTPWSGYSPSVTTTGLEERHRKFFLYSDLRYEYFPKEDFFGLGGQSKASDETDFLLERASYNLVTGLQASRRLTFAFRAGLSQIGIGAGGDPNHPNTDILFTEDTAPGLALASDFFELASSVLIDYRDVAENPHQGAFLSLSFQRFGDVRRKRFDFYRLLFDGRAYLPLGSSQRILAFRFLTSLDDAAEGAQVPFYLQKTLGSNDTLRGFDNYRFRGEDLLHFSAEYRWEAAPALEFAAFYDTGKVFRDRSEFRFDHLEKSIGLGVRFKTPEGVFIRIDLARSEETHRIHFTVGHPF